MGDGSSSTDGQWAEAWMQMQQEYWKTWAELSRRLSEQTPSTPPDDGLPRPWQQGIDFWSGKIAAVLPAESRVWLEKLLAMNKGYVQIGELLWKTLTSGAPGAMDGEKSWEAFNRNLSDLQQGFGANSAGEDPWKGLATFWGLPSDMWSRVASACSIFPGDMERTLRELAGAKVGQTAPAMLTEWLSTPTLGYTRESQEEFQRLGQSVIAYQKAMQDYAEVLSGVARRASELLRDKALDRARSGKSFESLRDYYNLWVDCGEEAYAEVCSSSEFTSAQARLVNALMTVKRQEQILMDEWLSALNMPTRRELDTSHRRVHELQRRVWRLEDASENTELSALRAEVAALREEMQSLRAASPGVAAATNPRRSTKAKADT